MNLIKGCLTNWLYHRPPAGGSNKLPNTHNNNNLKKTYTSITQQTWEQCVPFSWINREDALKYIAAVPDVSCVQ